MVTTYKVVAYITAGRRLLVFEHVRFPEAGVQVVQGTVEEGETPKDAVMREAEEETGLKGLTFIGFLGCEEYELCRCGSHGRQQSSYYHLGLEGPPVELWRHNEEHPSDGSAPIEFEFYWVSLNEVPPLAAGQDRYLQELR